MAELKALNLSDENLTRLSEITEADIIIAQTFITKVVDKEFKNLLLAKDSELEGMENE